MKNVAKTVAILAVMTALSLVLSLVESLIPMPIPIPGIKLGLANIVTLVLLKRFGLSSILSVSATRCVLAAVFSGAVSSLMFGLAGGMSSAVVMWLFHRKSKLKLSLTGVSIIGAATHNTAQIAVAMLMMRDTAVLNYLPVLLLFSVPAGFAVGFCALKTLSVLPDSFYA
ncbi:MAG: Gx transporter family protein [Oscillospiraceae bacterium]|nr:Gx transporter family protein [Oscillospiraceae bacterium]